MATTKTKTAAAKVIKAPSPRGTWAMTQTSIAHHPAVKGKVCKTRTRREGQRACRDY